MSEDTTKFYKFPSSPSASLTIPYRTARQLGWISREERGTHFKEDIKRDLHYAVISLNEKGGKGLFLYLSPQETGEKTLKFYKYRSATSPTVTIPLRLAQDLQWKHKDTITVGLKSMEGNIGLLFYKIRQF